MPATSRLFLAPTISSWARIVPELIHVLDAVTDIRAILPHAVERKVLDGAPLTCWLLLCRNKHRDDRALFDLHISKGPEDAVFVFGGDRHSCGSLVLSPVSATSQNSKTGNGASFTSAAGLTHSSCAALPIRPDTQVRACERDPAQEMRLIHPRPIVVFDPWSDLLGRHVGVRADVLRECR